MKYIETGIEWCPKVPEHWKELLFKNCVSIQNGKDYKDIESSGGIPVIGSGGQFAYCTQTMYDGEVVFMGRKGTIDRPLYYNGPFWAVDTMFYAIPKKGFSAKYLYYLAVCFPYKKIYTQTALPSMTQMALRNLTIYIPEYSEQQRMVDYLDTKLSEIDKQVALLTSKRDAYLRLKKSIINNAVTKGLNPNVKLKDSGIDWIGEIPEHWGTKRGKDSIKVLYGFPADSNKFSDGDGIPLIRIRDIDSDKTEATYTGYYPEAYLIKTGDLLVGMDGDFNVAKWKGKTALLNQRVCKLSSKKSLFQEYLYYTIGIALKEINEKKVLTTVKHLSAFDIGQLSLPMPPLEEQIQIAYYLDDKCSKIDSIVENLEKQISRFADLKRALIDEVITGKRAV